MGPEFVWNVKSQGLLSNLAASVDYTCRYDRCDLKYRAVVISSYSSGTAPCAI